MCRNAMEDCKNPSWTSSFLCGMLCVAGGEKYVKAYESIKAIVNSVFELAIAF